MDVGRRVVRGPVKVPRLTARGYHALLTDLSRFDNLWPVPSGDTPLGPGRCLIHYLAPSPQPLSPPVLEILLVVHHPVDDVEHERTDADSLPPQSAEYGDEEHDARCHTDSGPDTTLMLRIDSFVLSLRRRGIWRH